jgi:hypothetical protein
MHENHLGGVESDMGHRDGHIQPAMGAPALPPIPTTPNSAAPARLAEPCRAAARASLLLTTSVEM